MAAWAGAAQGAVAYDQTQAVVRTPVPGRLLPRTALAVNAVNNGSFETNGGAGISGFSGWTVVDQASGSGSWYAQTGTTSPTSGAAVMAPTNGSFAAMTDQGGGGSHVLYQDIAVPANGGTLVFDLFINNQAGAFSVPSPASLDFTVVPNQQFRADLISTTAADFDVGAGVLANIYQTLAGDPLTSGYTTISFDLGAFAGQTVRLRFAEVDNQSFFQTGIDNVGILAAPTSVPVLGGWGLGLLMAALALAGGMAWWRRAA
jgi:hypothetical protein